LTPAAQEQCAEIDDLAFSDCCVASGADRAPRSEGRWVFRKSVTGDFGIVTGGFGNVTGHFGDVTAGPSWVT